MPTTTGNATQLITFSRGSLATVTDADGKIKWAGHNLLLASEQFDASSWTKTNVTVAANSIAAPNGTTTADKIVENNATASHQIISSSVSVDAGATYVASVFCKPAGRDFAMFQFNMGGVNSYAIVNLTTAVFGTPTNVTGSATFSASALSNGWVQLTATATTISSSSGTIIIYPASNATTFNYTGDGSSGVYAWGASVSRSDLGGMQANASAYPMYNPSTPRNLLGWSEAFDNAAWTKSQMAAFGSGSIANAIAAPNGSLSADKIVADTASGYHAVRQSATVTTAPYVFSFYAKAAEYSLCYVTDIINAQFRVAFNLATGAVVAGTTGGARYVSSAITSAGDGWYRCSVSIAGMTSNPTFALIGYPSSGATLDAYGLQYTGDGSSGIYLWGAQLSDSASLDPYVGSYGAAPSAAAAHGPRLDYDPVTLAARGLLVEETRANLLQRSQEFSNAFWIKAFSSFTATTTTAPDGSSAAKLVNNADVIEHYLRASFTSVASRSYAASVYVKAAEITKIRVQVLSVSSPFQGFFVDADLTAGTIGTPTAANGGTVLGGAISNAGSGWYRISVAGTIGAKTDMEIRFFLLNASGAVSYSGNGTDGAFFFGAQLEENASFATSYIPNSNTAMGVQRLADVASVATSQFPYSASEGTVVAAYSLLANTGSLKRVFDLYDTTKGNYENIIAVNGININNSVIYAEIVNGSSGQASFALGTPAVGASHKSGIAFAANNINAANNGTLGTLDPTGTIPSANTLRIGAHADSTVLNGWIRQITYLPRRISDSELQARTV